MKKVLSAILALAALAACQTLPSPTAIPSQLELRMGNTLGVQAAYQTETGLSFTPESVALVCDDAQSGYRYLQRRFVVTNNTGSTLTNLQIHAYNKAGNAGSTALKSITGFGGNASPDATQALPRHGVGATCSTAPFVPSADYADLQLYSDAEITARTGLAGSSLSASEYLLGYGYLVRQRASQTNADSNDRTLANGESGFVTIGLRVPVGVSSAYTFSMTFLTFTDTVNELVQTPEDQFAGTTAGLNSLPVGASRVSVLGGAACGLSGTNRFQNKLVLAKDSISTVKDSELNAPSITTTISSNAGTGTGSLREAIQNAGSGNTICFTQSITLASELSIGQNLNLLAGENTALSGSSATRVLNISAGTVNLYGFTIQNGRTNAGGAAIRNAGTLNLFGMKVQNNTATGTVAQGGGIYSSGAVSAKYSKISSNTAQGDMIISLTGLPGNSAQGGGVYLSGGSLGLIASTITNNTAQGSIGGFGTMGLSTFVPFPEPGMWVCITPPGNGSNGGAATGGGVYRTTVGISISGSGLVSNNIVTGGTGGFGGIGANGCPSASSGSVGVASSPDIF
ncbi:MAG: hypothetical protein RLZZ156_2761 [Deinococcota bacterium]|jgi:hypothetical protein